MTATPTNSKQFDSAPLDAGQEASALVETKVTASKGRQTWFWSVVWLLLLATSSALGIWAVAFITRLPPLPNCDQISVFSADSERLYCARQAAVSGSEQDLVAGIQLISAWDDTHPLYQDSQEIANRWSKGLFKLAQQRMQRGHLERATQLLGYVPARAEIYEEAQVATERWQREWSKGEEITTAVTTDARNQNWSGARKQLREIKRLTSDYWLKERYRYLGQHIQQEEDARRMLIQAKTLASDRNMETLAEALTLVQQIEVQTYAWPEAKPLMTEWAEALLTYGLQKWEQEELDAAIAVIQKVPADLATNPETQDLVQFAHAQRLATFRQDWQPAYGDILNLMDAIQAMQGIKDGSPFYPDAQTKLELWTNQLSDLKQLYGATLVANFNQKASFQTAIEQAQSITADRPQRQQAQTLIAHWSKEIQRIEDRPFLGRAQQLAENGDKASLQAAIAEAAKIEQGRALRIDAQTKIAQWTKQIQVLEDQPLYSKALDLASKGKLQDAITEARKIQKGRALYSQAQDSIKDWTNRIQVAEDRPILDEAKELAYQGRLSDAITVAARIAPGRALYREARNAIAIWDAERSYIQSLQQPIEDIYYEEEEPDYE
ncbi:hypothetical protein N836_08180 [Leptolyngbya sp. Heron Island J]|uniref:hypothetical protein n=1 Tax=Leptolyngbya sp. Heron Island J TaxID=1385935 RepID=UPI0003B9992F|nr:hypothetical protein [Leptolyngbya sp. Heron Island J]ESA36310.1 hypothetical protein N836_08180 [Leptolyngbya sp. Heron Island J]